MFFCFVLFFPTLEALCVLYMCIESIETADIGKFIALGFNHIVRARRLTGWWVTNLAGKPALSLTFRPVSVLISRGPYITRHDSKRTESQH